MWRRIVAQDPFEAFGREFKRAMEEHGRQLNEEMKRVHEQMHSAMQRMKEEMDRAGAELQRAMRDFHRERSNYTNSSEVSYQAGMRAHAADRTSRRDRSSSKRKRPPRKPRGSVPAPVKPSPKPTPLMDGAEAPIE